MIPRPFFIAPDFIAQQTTFPNHHPLSNEAARRPGAIEQPRYAKRKHSRLRSTESVEKEKTRNRMLHAMAGPFLLTLLGQ